MRTAGTCHGRGSRSRRRACLLVEDDRKLVRALERGLAREGYEVDVAYSGEDGARARPRPYVRRGRARRDAARRRRLRGVRGPARASSARSPSSCSPPVGGGRPDPRARRGRRRLPRQAVRLRRAARAPAGTQPAQASPSARRCVEVGRAAPRRGHAHRDARRACRSSSPRASSRCSSSWRATTARSSRAGRCSSRSGTATTTGRPNVVDVYVGYLRRKLDDPSGRQLIRTVRGVGFCLESW